MGRIRPILPASRTRFEVRHDLYQLPGLFPIAKASDWCGEFAPRTARVAIRRDDEANAAFISASQQDATDANVAATVGECQSGREPGSLDETLGTPPAKQPYRGPWEQRPY